MISGDVEFADLAISGETTITKTTVASSELAQKGGGADLLEHMIQFVA